MQNNTKKFPILEEQKKLFIKITNNIEIDNGVSPLGNIEIGKRYDKIKKKYEKYQLKQISQYALTMGNITDRPLEKRRLEKTLSKPEFKLKVKNDKLLKKINMMLCSCGRDIHFSNKDKIVDFKEYNEVRRLKGLKSCGNNATCPVCAAKLSAIRGGQLKELMTSGRENGRSYAQVVITLPHQPLEPLDSTLNYVIDMSRYIFNDRKFKEFKKITKCRFVHGGLENMVSFKNGQVDWHPHKNYLLDFDISINKVIQNLGLSSEFELRLYISRLMTSIGQKYLGKHNIDKTLLIPYMQENLKTKKIDVKGGVSVSLEFDDEYITKWGLDAEMTASIYKQGRFDGSMLEDGTVKRSFHPFGLLRMIDKENKETSKDFKYQCAMAFQEFVLASRGKWWFYFARGSVNYYNENYGSKIKVKKDDLELQTLEDKGDIFLSLAFEEWKLLKNTPRQTAYMFSLDTQKDVIEFVFEEIEKNRIAIVEKYNCRISTYLSKRKKDEKIVIKF